MLMGGPHNTYAAHNKDSAHFYLDFIPAPGKIERFPAQARHRPLTVPKANNRGLRCVKNESHARPAESTPAALIRGTNHAAPPQSRARPSAARHSASSPRPGFADSASPFLALAA